MKSTLAIAVALAFLSPAVKSNGTNPHKAQDLYELKASKDDELCGRIASAINAELRKTGRIRLARLGPLPKWSETENLKDTSYRGDILQTDVDIDNDGSIDRVYKTRLSVRGAKTESLHIFHGGKETRVFPGRVDVKGIFDNADRRIDFLSSGPWLERAKALYGNVWEKWFFSGTSAVHPFRFDTRIYVAAHHAFAAKDVASRFYVFELFPGDKIQDKCMLEKG